MKNQERHVTDEMVTAAMRAFERMSSVLRYREKDKWHTCDIVGMRDALKAALSASWPAAIPEPTGVLPDDLARVLYEAEYDGERYPWHTRSSSDQLTYKQQAEAALAKFSILPRNPGDAL